MLEPKNSISLAVKIALVKAVLATTIPQIKYKITQEANIRVFNIHYNLRCKILVQC